MHTWHGSSHFKDCVHACMHACTWMLEFRVCGGNKSVLHFISFLFFSFFPSFLLWGWGRRGEGVGISLVTRIAIKNLVPRKLFLWLIDQRVRFWACFCNTQVILSKCFQWLDYCEKSKVYNTFVSLKALYT